MYSTARSSQSRCDDAAVSAKADCAPRPLPPIILAIGLVALAQARRCRTARRPCASRSRLRGTSVSPGCASRIFGLLDERVQVVLLQAVYRRQSLELASSICLVIGWERRSPANRPSARESSIARSVSANEFTPARRSCANLVRREPSPKLLLALRAWRTTFAIPALPRVVDRTARERRESGPENHARIEQIGIVDDAFGRGTRTLR